MNDWPFLILHANILYVFNTYNIYINCITLKIIILRCIFVALSNIFIYYPFRYESKEDNVYL